LRDEIAIEVLSGHSLVGDLVACLHLGNASLARRGRRCGAVCGSLVPCWCENLWPSSPNMVPIMSASGARGYTFPRQ
jgi:hypothetical protein